MIRHFVFVKFKDSLSDADVAEMVRLFARMADEIDEVAAFEYGPNNSTEGLTKGLEHCFNLTFATVADRDAYLPHPKHEAFKDVFVPTIADVMVFDYEVAE
ncbi:conserved hypothetical protein [Hahella chejuensis KCTC 2396]|uniref:Stress-response A/B barrel domain-containing protein n=1 Tax=Hahella chejuensis (strain KCTC 2396) TaxID=349521 RepID=Q2SKN2_HAHCH|nr:Dabb family protein [Hahella chejuensis]ABC28792.1 conserved hypothetical protein [Hahella chejuensis KCTC 2396]